MLPTNEKRFHISVVGETSQNLYEGEFRCVCVPTAALRNKIHRDETRETGDMQNIPAELYYRALWLVNCQNRVTEGPEWWAANRNGALLLDDNVLKVVYDKCIEAETEWRTNVKTKASSVATSTDPATTPAST